MATTINAKTIGEVVARALGLQPGDDVEIARDRLNPNRLLVVRSNGKMIGDVCDAEVRGRANEL
ncbi:MAG: hypothetical protein ABSG74_10550 [Candidatus Bathyarchaeia archaeon]